MKKKTSKTTDAKLQTNAKHFFKRVKKKSTVRKKKNRKQLKFPNIFRFITERKYFIAFLVLFVISLAIIIVGVNLYKNISEKEEVDKERRGIIKEVEFWKEVVSEYKDYRDAYFQLALLEYRLGDYKASGFYLQKTFELDPNFEKGRELERILNVK